MPICSGENLYTNRGFRPYLEAGAMDVAIGAGAGNTISANSNYSLAIGDDAGTGVTGGNANQAIGYHAGININGGYNQTEGDAARKNPQRQARDRQP